MSEPLTAAEVQRLAEVIGLPVEAEVLASVAEQLTALLAAASGCARSFATWTSS